MNKLATLIHSPGRLTALAALLAGLSAPALAAPGDVVISQVYGGGGNAGATLRHDFVELFNRSASRVDIGGWTLQYASGTGNSWTRSLFPAGTSLAPGQYLVVRLAAGNGGTTDTPADLVGATALTLGGTSGKVALVKNNTALSVAKPSGDAVSDWVGYGTANGEGEAPAGALTNTTAAFRAEGGCTDSDNNGADFTAAAASPRAGQSRPACGGIPDEPIVPVCPASLVRPHGELVSAILNASDKDNRVTSAAITSAAVTGIRLEEFAASETIDTPAGVRLVVDASTPAGNHAVVVTFTNNASKAQACTVTVRSAGSQTIPAIQGAGAQSSFRGTAQTTEGVITAKVSSGYFVQDPDGDNDPATSDAIFVFDSTGGPGAIGERVRVTGLVTEYQPSGSASYTELTESRATVLGAGATVTPTNISFPAADLEPYEGMLVRITNPLTVNQNKYLGTRGELTLSSGRLELPTNRYRAGTPEAKALAAANAANVITLDDSIFTTPPVVPYIGVDGTVRAGDTVTGLEGVLDFGTLGAGGAGFKLQPTVAPEFSRTNPRLEVPSLPAGIRVASANVLNFFTTFTDKKDVNGQTTLGCSIGGGTPSAGNCRGADNMDEFVRQRDKIVKSLVALNADVVGLMEIQNNGDVAVQYLVDSINAALGANVYAVVPKPASTGTDAIRVAMIYKPAALTLVGGALSDDHGVNNRPPMAQTFKAANGAKFSVIVNHLKAKAGCPSGSGLDTDRGDGQSCWNATRVNQAKRLADYFIPLVKASAGDDDILVIGDMNAYGFEDPIVTLTDAGLVNELERFVRPQGLVYSYVFDGESGYLDHALTTQSLSTQVAGAAEWHNNADEPEAIDYNFDGVDGRPKAQDLFASDAFRASDHDPVLVSLNLTPTWIDATASFSVYRSGIALNRATGQYSGSVQFTNKTGAPITGPFHVKVAGLPAGVTLANASGSHNGVPYVTANAGTIAPGATVSVSTVFNNPSKVAINYSAAIIAGTF